ncbi:MAG: HDIG domain-containing metalloprotein [Cyanobacteria bacterium J06597_16]
MRVLRHFATWVHQLWSRSFLRLKHPGRYLKRRLNRKCVPLVNSAQRLFALESEPKSAPKRTPQGKRAKRAHRNAQPSTAQLLLTATATNRTWALMLLSIVLLTVFFGQRFYSQPGLDVRSVATQALYAPKSAVVEDKRATENVRNNALSGSLQVLRIDPSLTDASRKTLETLLSQGRELRQQAGSPPFLNLETLSKPTQDFLFQASDYQWRTVWSLAEQPKLSSDYIQSEIDPDAAQASSRPSKETAEQVRSLAPEKLAALQELTAYRESLGQQGLSLLETRVDTARQQYRKAADELAAEASADGQPLYNYRLFELSSGEWYALEDEARAIFDDMMLQGIHPGAPPDLLRRAIESRVSKGPSPEVNQLTADLLSASVSFNLAVDEERSRLRAQQAAADVVPVTVAVTEGELIVDVGETIDTGDFALLDHFDLTGRYFNWIGLCGFSVLVMMAVAFYLWVDDRQSRPLNHRDHLLVLMLCLVVAVLAGQKVIPTVGLPAVGLLIGSFYGARLGITVISLLVSLLMIGAPFGLIPLIAGTVGALLGTWISPQLRSREEFALLGGFVGLGQASAHLVLTLMRSTVTAPLWQSVFVDSALYGLYGIAWSVVALGVSPYLEHFFDVVTPIRLAELANPNRPLLKRLAAEAPGTFQHTMFVANLAEAAARALGRNVELVRAGTLYHDIGKMHDPQGFIENQMGGTNKHDLIDDPWKSAILIKKHVTQGIVMARKYRLPKAVQAFIPEHQGDMKISYFYQQAKERQEKQPSLVINASDFSYDGPIPQSPETGITMLADSCEAALRSLKPEASMDEAYTMVDKILRARWRNRQLIDSGLSRDDMDMIASVFIQVWQQHNHKRISYPKNALLPER